MAVCAEAFRRSAPLLHAASVAAAAHPKRISPRRVRPIKPRQRIAQPEQRGGKLCAQSIPALARLLIIQKLCRMRQVRILTLRRPVEKLAERVHKLFGQLWFVRTRRKQRRMQSLASCAPWTSAELMTAPDTASRFAAILESFDPFAIGSLQNPTLGVDVNQAHPLYSAQTPKTERPRPIAPRRLKRPFLCHRIALFVLKRPFLCHRIALFVLKRPFLCHRIALFVSETTVPMPPDRPFVLKRPFLCHRIALFICQRAARWQLATVRCNKGRMLLHDLHIGGYRGLRDLHLEGLGRVNVLIGQNNSGKSSVLEAAALLARPFDDAQWTRVIQSRDSFLSDTPPHALWGAVSLRRATPLWWHPTQSRGHSASWRAVLGPPYIGSRCPCPRNRRTPAGWGSPHRSDGGVICPKWK